MWIKKVKKFWKENKTFKIVLAVVVGLAFIGSLLGTILGGGELTQKSDASSNVKGLIRISQADYETEYSVGDKFVFDKDNSVIMLVAKDPLIANVVRIEKLPVEEFGFQVNGEGKIYDNPSDIVINGDVKCVSLVSTYYTELKTDIEIKVAGAESTGGNEG